jgi:hypothetical protein
LDLAAAFGHFIRTLQKAPQPNGTALISFDQAFKNSPLKQRKSSGYPSFNRRLVKRNKRGTRPGILRMKPK